MKTIEKKIIGMEELLLKKPNYKNAIATSLRYYSSYLLGNISFLSKALRAVASALATNPSSVHLFLLDIFYNIEINNLDTAEETLNSFKSYRAYYKNSGSDIYGIYIYLNSLLLIKQGKTKKAQKTMKQLKELGNKGYIYDLLMGDLYLRLELFDEAMEFLGLSYTKGGRSFFMYYALHNMSKEGTLFKNELLFNNYLKWALSQGILKDYVIEDNRLIAVKEIKKDLSLYKEIYNLFNIDWLLIEICKCHIENSDFSYDAYLFYKKAESKQLSFKGLSKALVKASALNDEEDISLYIMSDLIENYLIDTDILPYVYHQLITKKKFSFLINEYKLNMEIIRFALNNIKTNKSRYYLSIYHYCLDSIRNRYKDIAKETETILYENLFLYEGKFEDLSEGFVWVSEKEISYMDIYKIENGKCMIKSPTGNFKYIVMDSSNKKIINYKATFKRQLETAGPKLYTDFLSRGYEDLNIYLALSDYYINLEKTNEDYSLILNKTLSFPELSPVFRMQVSAALGNLLFLKKDYDAALQYFKDIDENYISEKHMESMLNVFINAGDYTNAIRIINKKREFISDRALFIALKEISKKENLRQFVANPAYELLMNNYYDRNLLDIVLDYYRGSQEEWLQLSSTLLSLSADNRRLDEIILENSIWMHDFSPDSQEVFIRMYKLDKENELVKKYIYFACYEMLINLVKPEYETLSILEKVEMEAEDSLLSYSLSRIYLHFGMRSFHSEEIMKRAMEYMEFDNIIIPEFKNIKDKTLRNAYIEKNQPFIYKCSSNKKVFLYYKLEEDSEYKSIEMDYKIFGIFSTVLPLFYNEKISFYFSEQISTGSIDTKEEHFINNRAGIKENTSDTYFLINNAIIYDQMFKYDEAEKIINDLLSEKQSIIGNII